MEDIHVSITKHEGKKDDYSLGIEGNDFAFHCLTHGYDHRKGNHMSFTLQGVTLANIYKIAQCIMDRANEMERQATEAVLP